ncbi:peptide deformylase, partial [bacterium]
PVLRKKAGAVDKLTPADKKLIKDMYDTMEAADGAGLAAPQVGVSKRIFVFRVGDEKHALINPRIIKREGQRVGDEGCLSIPGVQAKVKRAKRVVIVGRDEKGKPVEWDLEDNEDTGRAATCVQHELDHLDGIMYLQRANADTISWLIEGIDDEGDDSILLEKTSPEEILASFKSRKLPRDVHVPDMLRERVEKKK